MTVDPRLHRIVPAQPYPLLFATISGRISTDFHRRIRITICAQTVNA